MTTTTPRNPFTRRGFIAAAIIVGVIVLAALIVLITSLTRPTTTTDATPTQPPTPSAAPTENPADASICGLPGYEKTSSLTVAPNNKWELVGTVAAPTDLAGSGPGNVDNGFRSCFAHTAEGALYAAVNFIALGTDGNLRTQLPKLVAPGAGKDAIELQMRSATPDASTTGPRGQVAGFKISSYDGLSATVDLVLNYSTGALVSAPVKLVWVEGDWKFVLTDTGSLPLASTHLENLGGYIPWAGA